MRPRRMLTALLGVAMLTSTGCVDTSGLRFTQDDRLDFTAPPNNAELETPVTLTWTMADFDVLPYSKDPPEPTDDAGYYAVFVDQSPIKPGRTLADIGEDDPACTSNPRCPDRFYLEAAGVYVTRKPMVRLVNVPPLKTKEDVQQHEVTVILMDSEGRRIGESSWFREFRLENKSIV